MTKFDTDLFVIGAGSGGVRAARIAAGYGAKVMIAEESRIGGTCVIRGCVPKKLLVYASRFPHAFEDAVGFGFSEKKPEFSWERLRDRVEAEVTRLSGLYRKGLEGAGVAISEERAVITGPQEVRLASGRKVSARTILVATGGRPSRQGSIIGADLAIISDDVFHLPSLPRRMVVLGAGYIALEFASVFSGLGTKVHLVHRGDAVLRGFDEDLRKTAAHSLDGSRRPISFRAQLRQDRDHGGRRTTRASAKWRDTRRRGRADRHGSHPEYRRGSGLENAGVELGEKGRGEGRSRKPQQYRLDLRDRGRHQSLATDAGCDPRRPCLCRQRIRGQGVERGPHQRAFGGIHHTGDRHDRPHAGGRLRAARGRSMSIWRISAPCSRRSRAATRRCS